MPAFRDLSIRWKTTIVSMLASMLVLALACLAFFVYDLVSFRRDLVARLGTEARIVGLNSAAALLFDDAPAAEQVLGALRTHPQVVSAAIYADDGRPFATYQSNLSTAVPSTVSSSLVGTQAFGRDRVTIVQEIEFKGKHVGYVALEADLREMYERGYRYAGIVLVVLIVAGLSALILVSRLQRVVTRPIFELVATVRRIAEEKDYAVRAPVRGHDEIGLLVGSFNDMLARIQERDAQVRAARDQLEQRVADRTHALKLEVAERSRAQEALAMQAEELARSNAELEQFAYVASHDLQEPLRMVASYTQLLEETEGERLTPASRKYVQYAVDGATRMRGLINDLLAYSRVARAERAVEVVDCNAVMRQVLLDLEVAIDQSGVAILCDPLPTVRGDASQLAQLFQNLIANAIKFRRGELPRIDVTVDSHDGMARFAVRDNGIGIDPKYAEKVFVIFQRLHSRATYPGTGIGLAICKRIVERHGGSIWLESQPGQGATFYFTIPHLAGEEAVHHERTATG